MPVKGIKRVKANYRALMKDISGQRTETGVLAVMTQGGNAAAVMTPVDTSTLINSHFVELDSSPGKVVGKTGYTADYAAAVHAAPGKLKGEERPDGRGQFWDPSGEPGFLEKGFEEIKPAIPAILKRAYKV